MDDTTIARFGDELYAALRSRTTVAPLTERVPGITIEDAYHVSLHMVERRVADGERIVGKNTGVTGIPVQRMLNVHQPDFGYLTDKMVYQDGAEMPISTELIQPRAEGEIAFVLAKDLVGPGVTEADAIAATDYVVPCFEVVDSRIHDWKIKIQDTVADNASSGLFLLGSDRADPRDLDLFTVGMVVEKNGQVLSTGAGAAALRSPANCVAWLANTLGELGVPLKAGEIILSGSLVPLEPVVAGDHMKVTIAGIGSATVRFV
jgi:2-oxopent-4-enoate/cis-2-oxohex-4-enoate hydratase